MANNDIEMFFGIMGIISIFIFIGFAIQIVIAYLLYEGISRIPQQNRNVEPYFAWLTIIPLAGIVFLWILLPFKIPESMKSYFINNSKNQNIPNDFGKSMGLGTVISLTLTLVPYISMIAWIPLLVFLVLFMIQFNEMVSQLPTSNYTQHNINTNSDKIDQLIRLKNLLDNKIITDDEYNSAKQKLL